MGEIEGMVKVFLCEWIMWLVEWDFGCYGILISGLMIVLVFSM